MNEHSPEDIVNRSVNHIKMKYLIIVAILAVGFLGFSQISSPVPESSKEFQKPIVVTHKAFTEDGQVVFLLNNGTYEFLEEELSED